MERGALEIGKEEEGHGVTPVVRTPKPKRGLVFEIVCTSLHTQTSGIIGKSRASGFSKWGMWNFLDWKSPWKRPPRSMTSKPSKNRFGGLFNGYISQNSSVFVNSSSIVTILGTRLGHTMCVTSDL